MATTYANTAIDVVLKGVEKLLETEFGVGAAVYIAKDYKQQSKSKSIRLCLNGSDQIARASSAFTRRYEVTVSCYLKKGQMTERRQEEEVNELATRSQRVLEENSSRYVSSAYQWHDGQVEPVDNEPDLTDGEAEITDLSVVKFDYLVSVTEVGSSL